MGVSRVGRVRLALTITSAITALGLSACGEAAAPVCATCSGPDAGAQPLHGRLGAGLSLAQAGNVTWLAAFDRDFGALLVGEVRSDGSWSPIRVDAGGPNARGLSPALAVGPGGEPTVLYGAADGAVRLARRANGAWSHDEVRPANGIPYTHGSVAVDAAGGVHAAWSLPGGAGFTVASWASGGCRAPDGDTVREVRGDDMAAIGRPSDHFGGTVDLAISPSEAVVVAYHDRARGNLMLATCAHTALDLRVIDGEGERDTGDVGEWGSLSVDQESGRLGIAYHDRGRGLLRFVTSEQGEPLSLVIDDGSADGRAFARHVGQLSALAYEDDAPRVAYLDASRAEVRLASVDAFGTWRIATVGPFELGAPATLAVVALPGDRTRLASVRANGSLRFWDCEGMTCVAR